MSGKSGSIQVVAAALVSFTLIAGNAAAGTVKHHSKAKGAVVGGVAGHVVVGKKGAVAGAAAGAAVQHHKNKKQGTR